MLTATQAIVCHKTKYGDGRLLISMYTRTYGMMSFSYTTSHSSRGGVVNLFQALTVVDIEFDLKPKADIHRLLKVRLSRVAHTIHLYPQKMAIALFLADVMRFSLSHEQQNEELYAFLLDSIDWLDDHRGDVGNFHIIFSLNLLRFLGVAPPPVHEGFFTYDTMGEMRLTQEERNEMLEKVVDYYETHLPSFPRIKSLEVIKEIL